MEEPWERYDDYCIDQERRFAEGVASGDICCGTCRYASDRCPDSEYVWCKANEDFIEYNDTEYLDCWECK